MPKFTPTFLKRRPKKSYKKKAVRAKPRRKTTFKTTGLSRHFDSLSPCVKNYAKAVVRASSIERNSGCVPYPGAVNTMKVTHRSLHSGKIGTAGVGGVLICPSLANDSPMCYITQATFPGTVLDRGNGTAGVFSSPNPIQFPITIAQLTSGNANGSPLVYGRIVAMEVKVTWEGSPLNEIGRYYGAVHPQHGNLSGLDPTNLSSLSSFKTDFVHRGKEFYLNMSAITESELKFPEWNPYYASTGDGLTTATYSEAVNFIYPLSSQTNINPSYPTIGAAIGQICLVGDGTNANWVGSAFTVEVFLHAEYTGTSVQYGMTPNKIDTTGVNLVMNAVNGINQTDNKNLTETAVDEHMRTEQSTTTGTGNKPPLRRRRK